MRRNVAFLCVVFAAVSAFSSSKPAAACGNAVSAEEERVRLIKAGDRMLAEGKYKGSAELMMQFYPSLKTLDTQEKLALRARRIVALAIVRTDGLLPMAQFGARSVEERRQNLEWAEKVMRDSNTQIPNTPVIQAGLGETLAQLPEHMAEAYTLLQPLAEKDVLPSAHAYRALAQLRRLSGDESGSTQALAKATQLFSSPPPTEPVPTANPNLRRRSPFARW